jgi:hypothetical protein
MTAVKHDVTIGVRVSREIDALVTETAHARGTKSAEWLRWAIRIGLTLDGFLKTPEAA